MHTSSTSTAPQVAFIREAECIGCTKCLNACPVDAIVGATRCLHTVIATDCTGCALCVTPCPMDCIELRPVDQACDPNRAHSNTMRKQQRLSSLQTDTDTKLQQPIASATLPSTADEDEHKKLRLAVQKTRMALGKAEQQFKRRQTPLLEEQIQRLRIALQQAEERLEQAQNASEYDCSQTSEPKDALHQAKLNLVAQRTTLKQAERNNLSADERAKLQEQVTSAEQALHEAEAQTLRPAPQHIRTVLNPLPEAIRDLKTELALARAALSREGRRSPPDPERLAQATAKVQTLEQQLAHASDSNSTLPST